MSRKMSDEMRRGLILSQAAAARNLAALATAEGKSKTGELGRGDRAGKATQVGDQDEAHTKVLVQRPLDMKKAKDRAAAADSAAQAAQTRAEAAASGAEAAADGAEAAADGAEAAADEAQKTQHAADEAWKAADKAREAADEARNAADKAREAAREAASLAGGTRVQVQKALDTAWLNRAADATIRAEGLAQRAAEQAANAEAAYAEAERSCRISQEGDGRDDAACAVERAHKRVEDALGEILAGRASQVGVSTAAESRSIRTRNYLMIERRALTAAGDALKARDAVKPPTNDSNKVDRCEPSWGNLKLADVPQVIRDDPQLAYAAACYLVRWRGVSFADRRIRELLDRAMVWEVFLQFAEDDPELSTAPDKRGFEALKARLAAEQDAREKQRSDAEKTTKEQGPRATATQES